MTRFSKHGFIDDLIDSMSRDKPTDLDEFLVYEIERECTYTMDCAMIVIELQYWHWDSTCNSMADAAYNALYDYVFNDAYGKLAIAFKLIDDEEE